jgi:hypothetical protein
VHDAQDFVRRIDVVRVEQLADGRFCESLEDQRRSRARDRREIRA